MLLCLNIGVSSFDFKSRAGVGDISFVYGGLDSRIGLPFLGQAQRLQPFLEVWKLCRLDQ